MHDLFMTHVRGGGVVGLVVVNIAQVLLYYEGFRYDHLVGTVKIKLDLNNLAPFENRAHVIADFGSEAERARNKAVKEGRGLPTISFSMWPSALYNIA